jgi:glucan phosphoethanolaminetransferase (alkaline phosphatase superfamily)
MKHLIPNHHRDKKSFNYLYFGIFFSFLIALNLFTTDLPLFFVAYGITQAFLEVCILILLTHLMQKWAPALVFYVFIALSFLLALLHFTQFTIARVMDTSVLYILRFFFLSGIDHLIVGLQALNLNWTMILIMTSASLAVPLLGVALFTITQKISSYKKIAFSIRKFLLITATVAAVLFTLDLSYMPSLSKTSYAKYKKHLPLGCTLFSPASHTLSLKAPFADPLDENQALQSMIDVKAEHLPNLYFFIIETLRKDFLDIAPNLSTFGNQYIHFDESFANANSTHLSWFSLFHASLPFHWTTVRDTWKQGSIPLQYLKKLGYKIHVYSSADLKFFNMDKILFGENMKLVDHLEEYTDNRSIEPCDRDALAINAIEKNLKKTGQAYFIFLDSTHSEYSFPKDYPIKYKPIASEINYLTISAKNPNLEQIKNRYRNAICYVDDLLGRFFHSLKKENLFDDAIIAITADHGEEFFEEGALFHGTHLNRYQTSVPIFLKIPDKAWVSRQSLATHIDLFPSILHYLTKQSAFPSMDGRSIFNDDPTSLRIAVLHNGSQKPEQFSLHKKDLSLQARFIDESTLDLISLEGILQNDDLEHKSPF